MKRIKFICGDEYDFLTKARKYLYHKPGEVKKVKKRYNRRFRSTVKLLMKKDYEF